MTVRKSRWVGAVLATVGLLAVGAAAQRDETPPAGIRIPFAGKPVTGTPTPGTPQPTPPNLADRITLHGCVQRVSKGAGEAKPNDASAPSDSKFVLTGAVRQNIVPEGTGGSTLAASASSRTYRLEAIESQLSAFVGMRVEISGEIKPLAPGASGAAEGDGTILQVEFVQKIAATCP